MFNEKQVNIFSMNIRRYCEEYDKYSISELERFFGFLFYFQNKVILPIYEKEEEYCDIGIASVETISYEDYEILKKNVIYEKDYLINKLFYLTNPDLDIKEIKFTIDELKYNDSLYNYLYGLINIKRIIEEN